MTIKIWCEECDGWGGIDDPHLGHEECSKCLNKGYREVTLEQLIKPLDGNKLFNYILENDIKPDQAKASWVSDISGFLNLELIK